MGDDTPLAAQPVESNETLTGQVVNKHGSVTQVENGFIFYAGGATFVAYTFEELVDKLKAYFA